VHVSDCPDVLSSKHHIVVKLISVRNCKHLEAVL
jgi:hypothetical protein